MTADGIGWHGNSMLVKQGIEVVSAEPVPLPAIEPRGAIAAELRVRGRRLRVVGMHLDLSGLRRRRQLRAVLAHLADCPQAAPAVLMGDFNEWATRAGALREFGGGWHVLAPGRSYPAPRPIAQLDRIVVSAEWRILHAGVHRSLLATRGSDHLPVFARLALRPMD